MANGMVKLADFGLGKTLNVSQAVAQSFVGVRCFDANRVISGTRSIAILDPWLPGASKFAIFPN